MSSHLHHPQPSRLIIIGAGWSGLIAASTYLRIAQHLHRPIQITILDEGNSPGGVWARDRLYPGLTANSPNGLYEYSHVSMVDESVEGRGFAKVLSGERVRDYLEKWCEMEGLGRRVRWGVRVRRCERRRDGEGWVVESEEGEKWVCEKLIVASGLYSKMRVPEVKKVGWEGVSLHSKELGRLQEGLRGDGKVRSVVVVGGCKSAVEACSLFLPDLNPGREFKVSWVVRPSDKGVPMAVVDMDQSAELLTAGVTRLFACLSPSIFWTDGFWYWFLHSGRVWLGFVLLQWLWYLLTWAVRKDARYWSSENGRKIEPKGRNSFHDLNAVSLIQKKASFLDYLHRDDEEILKVHRVTPVELRGREMIVVDEKGVKSSLPCDVVIWCTGWLPSVDFFDEEEARALGVPTLVSREEKSAMADRSMSTLPTAMLRPAEYWAEGLSEDDNIAEKRVIDVFPMLGTATRRGYPIEHTGFKLYRQILPTQSIEKGDRSIAFTGLVSNGQTAMCCELTSLWAVAWMEGLLPTERLAKSKAEADRNVELVSGWIRRRYGIGGTRNSEIVLEIQSYFDVLCRDLGVAWERKKKGVKRTWWDYMGRARDNIKEWTTPYTAADYRGIIEEFLECNGYVDKSRQ